LDLDSLVLLVNFSFNQVQGNGLDDQIFQDPVGFFLMGQSQFLGQIPEMENLLLKILMLIEYKKILYSMERVIHLPCSWLRMKQELEVSAYVSVPHSMKPDSYYYGDNSLHTPILHFGIMRG
jgi:hypothetical protein